ncbi:DNA-binding transcriptional regulator, LacI/PurR family [Amycolatopsis arida]|uniref:DNA-binding transcriptional regulator, LacI/PurR family n=1 Tax=Amycolatopsis arida TaxID=587909 RepID=A0A1I5LXG4_9PSEU|nr:LacI family DNA-binding transcriptional regulator [Amycolatopsis arida]TDX93887.1 DNA-binding LacI/PurR family transcriptional regulator [Amycolatopsis arida]SFP01965.1 DNA-binding transcriptional regulator, LacI/PurR family [Amycolatopsis arida]
MPGPGRARAARRPTLEQVAAEAGVSRGTVSRVVNGSLEVSAKTLRLVQDAIDKLGYVPNQAARSLVTRRTDTVLLVVSESEARVFTEPFLGGLVRGLSQELATTPLQLNLMMASTARQHERVEQLVRHGHVDGVALISLHGDDPLPRNLAAAGAPVVVNGRPVIEIPGVPYVDADNLAGARAATEYLYRQGRRRIATITGPQDMCAGIDRLAGFRAALKGRRGVTRLVAQGDFGQADGERAMRELLAEDPRLDAVFAASDLMAAGALRALRAAGRGVPDDVAVVGFDDSDVARNTDPALTSVRQPVQQMGRELARLLISRISRPDQELAPVILPTELLCRESA